jgi:hypothetical protein
MRGGRGQDRLTAILATRASTPSIQRVPLASLIIATGSGTCWMNRSSVAQYSALPSPESP